MKFLVANTLSGVGGPAFVAHGNRMADELGKQGYVTGEMWKNKSPSHLAVNMAGFSRLALPALHWTWSHEALRVWCNTCSEFGSACLEDVGIDRSPHPGFLENCQDPDGAVPHVSER